MARFATGKPKHEAIVSDECPLRLAAVCTGLVVTTGLAGAQSQSSWPERPVRLIVPFAPGAGTDAMGRLVAQKLGEVLGGNFVVENRAGASGAIGTQHVAQQPADGYTLLLVASPFTTVAASLPSAGYDPLRQFVPVGMIATGPLVWATNTKLPVNNMGELVALAKRRPGALNYGSAGAGGVNHLVLELLKSRTGTFITHIPYRGVAPATMDMLADQVQLVTGTIPALLPFIKDGRVKPLAVTSARRSRALPDVPKHGRVRALGHRCRELFRGHGACRNPAGRGGQAQCGDQPDRRHARCAGALSQRRGRTGAGFSGLARCLHRGRLPRLAQCGHDPEAGDRMIPAALRTAPSSVDG